MDIIIRNLKFAYGDQSVFDDFSMGIWEGETLCIMGASGCGKTTLLQLLTGRLTPQSGSIQGITGRRIGMVFQENRLCEDFTAAANVRLVCGRLVSGVETQKTRRRIEEHLRKVGLEEAMYKKVSELSGGMKRRVAIVRAMLAPSELLIMDEPFKGLDPDTRQLVMEYVKAYKGNRTLIVVTHEKEEADTLGGQLLQL